MVKSKRKITHFIEKRRRLFEGGLWPPPPLRLPPPALLVRFCVGLREAEERDPPSPRDKVGRSKPNSLGGCFATNYLNESSLILYCNNTQCASFLGNIKNEIFQTKQLTAVIARSVCEEEI